MKKLKQPTTLIPLAPKRRGIAQLELAIFLPLYAAMIAMLCTVFSFARTRNDVTLAARQEAWQQRYAARRNLQPIKTATKESATVGIILNKDRSPRSGRITGMQTRQATLWLKTLNLLTDMRQHHSVLADTWDHRTLKFESRASHGGLTMDRRSNAFGTGIAGAFRGLLNGNATNATLINSINTEIASSLDAVTTKITQLQQQTTQLYAKLSSLNTELRLLRKRKPVNKKAVAQIEKQIKQAKNELVENRRRLQKLKNILPYLKY